jgi:hypothetical protein
VMAQIQADWDADAAEQGEPKMLDENQVEQQPQTEAQQIQAYREALEPEQCRHFDAALTYNQ